MQDLLFRLISEFFLALSHPTRLEILDLLKEKEGMCVCQIVEELKREQSTISRHLNALKRSGIVEAKQEGVKSFYRIKDPQVYKVLDLVKSILQRKINRERKLLRTF